MAIDISFVSQAAVDYTRGEIKIHGYVEFVFRRADKKFDYPSGTMASYFGKPDEKERKRRMLQRRARKFNFNSAFFKIDTEECERR